MSTNRLAGEADRGAVIHQIAADLMEDSEVSKYVRIGDRRQIEADIDLACVTKTICQVEPGTSHVITWRWATEGRILTGRNHTYRRSLRDGVDADIRRGTILAGD